MNPTQDETDSASTVKVATDLVSQKVEQAYLMTPNNQTADQPSSTLAYEPNKISQTEAFQYAIQPPSSPTPNQPGQTLPPEQPETTQTSVAELKKQLLAQVATNNKGGFTRQYERFKPLLTALFVGTTYLALTYNEVAIAQVKQYVSPGSSLTTPVIVGPSGEVAIGKEPRLIIPKINVDIPVVYDVTTFEEGAIQQGLERGVVHYGTTALPGQVGNNVIVGHSSNNFFNQGQYKFAFVLLDRLETGDTFILHYKGTRYIYRVIKKAVIEPSDFSLIRPTLRPVTTLITCTPPGTSWHRLVIQAEQISPDPDGAEASKAIIPEQINSPVPGNAPSIWQRLGELFN